MLQPLSPSVSQEHSDVNEALIENHFDSEDGNRTGCRSVRHRQQQQSYSGLRSSGRSYSTYKSL